MANISSFGSDRRLATNALRFFKKVDLSCGDPARVILLALVSW